MVQTVRAFRRSTCIVYGDKLVAPLLASDGLKTMLDGGTGLRDWQAGDVLAIQPDGTPIGRPAGRAGDWELGLPSGSSLAYFPSGANGPCYLVPFVDA